MLKTQDILRQTVRSVQHFLRQSMRESVSLRQLRSMEMERLICIRAVCRQVMAEFCEPDTFQFFVSKRMENIGEYTLGELFPGAFTKDDIEKARVY